MVNRREFLAGLAAVGTTSTLPVLASPAAGTPIIVDNDFGGDPDGLFLLAHLLLCRSVSVSLIVGSHYKDFGDADLVPDKAQASADMAAEVLRFMHGSVDSPIIAGARDPLRSASEARPSAATTAIVREIMRGNPALPLTYLAGGSLTEIARAWVAEPGIGKRMRLVWIGGNEHPDLAAPPPGPAEPEYNFSLDRAAARIVFNRSDIEIWQVPRNAFRQMMISVAELEQLAGTGRLGKYLHDQVIRAERRLGDNLPSFIFRNGETYTLGDTALVTLTALQSAFQPDTATSRYALRPTPMLEDDGSYTSNPTGRPMRVYSTIDANLTWRDFVAKLHRR